MVQKAYQVAQTRFLIDVMYTVCLVKLDWIPDLQPGVGLPTRLVT